MTRLDHAPDAEQLLTRFSDLQERVISLHVAENVLLFDDLAEVLAADCRLAPDDFMYQPAQGTEALTGALAAFLNRGFGLDGEQALGAGTVSCCAGVRCALELAALALLPPQSAVLMPAPYWQGFEWIYSGRLGGRIVPVPLDSAGGFALTLDRVKQAYASTRPAPTALVLTHPNNPLGVNYPEEVLEEIFQWVLGATPMQIFSDEIYAHCQMQGRPGPPFRSALALPAALRHPDRVHVVWGFAKDFGLSGFRAGAIASRHAALHTAVRGSAGVGFSPLPSSNEWFLRKLFASPRDGRGPTWADRLMAELAPRLSASRDAVAAALDRCGIPHLARTHAALFFWLDLRRWLPPASSSGLLAADRPALRSSHLLDGLAADPRERALYERLIARARVSLLPGGTLETPEPGFFRLCFTAEPTESVVEAVDRIAAALGSPTNPDL
jgi:aspartate/methionine/tyrosine aminotransferase